MMSVKDQYRASLKQVFLRAGLPVILTGSLISFSFALPLVDSTKEPFFDLSQSFSQLMYYLSQSGGKLGAPFVAILMLVVLITRSNVTNQRRYKETILIVLIATIFAGGGAIVNEHVVKTLLQTPRPNIIWLAGDNGTGPLQMTPEQFYAFGNKQNRREPLSDALSIVSESIPMSESIKSHWIDETGYSLPSGHSFSAMFFATYFLTLAVFFITTKRIWVFYALLPWALAVCYSRSILRLHTPLDITIGGLQGIIIGLVAALIVRSMIIAIGSKK